MRKLIVILFLFIGISAYADKIYNFDDPIYVSNVNDGMSSIFPAYKIRNVDDGFFGVGEIHNVSNFSKLRKFGIKEGSIVFFVSDLPYKAIMSYLHIYILWDITLSQHQVDIKDFYYLVLVIRNDFCHK